MAVVGRSIDFLTMIPVVVPSVVVLVEKKSWPVPGLPRYPLPPTPAPGACCSAIMFSSPTRSTRLAVRLDIDPMLRLPCMPRGVKYPSRSVLTVDSLRRCPGVGPEAEGGVVVAAAVSAAVASGGTTGGQGLKWW